MLSIRHITTAGVLTLALAMPATAPAQIMHDLHAAQPGQQEESGHVLRGHDLHAADTTGTTVAAAAAPAAKPSGFDWEDAAIGAVGMLGLVFAAGGFALLGRDRPLRDAP